MKIRCRRDKFVPLFTLISSFTATRDVRPALQNVKMIADEKSVVLTATDGGLSAKGELSTEEGFVIESAGRLFFLRSCFVRSLRKQLTTKFRWNLRGRCLPSTALTSTTNLQPGLPTIFRPSLLSKTLRIIKSRQNRLLK